MTTTAHRPPTSSPWGQVQDYTEFGDGVFFVSTAGHGGFKVPANLNRQIPDYMRKQGGWYEEDCDWCIPVLVLAHLFPDPKRQEAARNTLRNWHPHSYARFFGVPVEELKGKSLIYDDELFKASVVDKWVCIAAYGSHRTLDKGMVGLCCTLGEVRSHSVEHRYYQVPAEQYQTRGSHGYVIRGDEQPWSDPDTAPPVSTAVPIETRSFGSTFDAGDGPSDADSGL